MVACRRFIDTYTVRVLRMRQCIVCHVKVTLPIHAHLQNNNTRRAGLTHLGVLVVYFRHIPPNLKWSLIPTRTFIVVEWE